MTLKKNIFLVIFLLVSFNDFGDSKTIDYAASRTEDLFKKFIEICINNKPPLMDGWVKINKKYEVKIKYEKGGIRYTLWNFTENKMQLDGINGDEFFELLIQSVNILQYAQLKQDTKVICSPDIYGSKIIVNKRKNPTVEFFYKGESEVSPQAFFEKQFKDHYFMKKYDEFLLEESYKWESAQQRADIEEQQRAKRAALAKERIKIDRQNNFNAFLNGIAEGLESSAKSMEEENFRMQQVMLDPSSKPISLAEYKERERIRLENLSSMSGWAPLKVYDYTPNPTVEIPEPVPTKVSYVEQKVQTVQVNPCPPDKNCVVQY